MGSKWTEEEITILKNNCNTNDIHELSLLIRNKTISQITKKLSLLGLKYKKVDKSKYKNLNQVFKDYKRILNAEIVRFIKDYPVQYDVLLFKYYIKKKNIIVNKDFLYNIYFSKLLKEAKLYSRVKKKWKSCFEFITACFPQYHLKEYKFKYLQVREGFWEKDYNCFDNIKEGIKKAKHDNMILYDKDILTLEFNLLYKYFHKSMIFFRGVSILEKYLTFHNIEYVDSNSYYYKNIRFDSKEEMCVYKILNNYLNVDKNKKPFLSKKQKYIPDFISNYKNYKIIIEYFGLYKKQPKDKIFVEYNKKTKDKIEYFNNLQGYYFISLFPSDLKNNFEGVRNKLMSFFVDNFNIDLKEASNL